MPGLSASLRYFQCCQSTDMRNGFDGLAGIVRNYAFLLNLITLAVNTYYDSSLMENYSVRYNLFILEVGFTGLIATVMPSAGICVKIRENPHEIIPLSHTGERTHPPWNH